MKNFIIMCSVGLFFGICSILILRIFIDSDFLIGWIGALITTRAIDYFKIDNIDVLKH